MTPAANIQTALSERYDCPGCKRPVVPYSTEFRATNAGRARLDLCKCACGRLFKSRRLVDASGPVHAEPQVTTR